MKLWTNLLILNVHDTHIVPRIWSLAFIFSVLFALNVDQIPLNVLLLFLALFCDLIVFFLIFLSFRENKIFRNKSWIYV